MHAQYTMTRDQNAQRVEGYRLSIRRLRKEGGTANINQANAQEKLMQSYQELVNSYNEKIKHIESVK
jgi:hypothetical protein